MNRIKLATALAAGLISTSAFAGAIVPLLALFVATISWSTIAFAETTITWGVPNGRGGFDFFDSRLDNTNGLTSGFASLSCSYNPGSTCEHWYSFSTHIDPRNPFVFDPTADVETYMSGVYSNITYTYKRNPHYDEDNNFLGADVIVIAHADNKYPTFNYYQRTEYFEVNGEYRIKRQERRDMYSGGWSRDEMPSIPISGHGIFDFSNSIIQFATGESISLDQYLSYWNTGLPHFSFDESSNFLFPLMLDGEIIGISLAYNFNPVPEPETWAMLLAGLGVMAGVAYRRKQNC